MGQLKTNDCFFTVTVCFLLNLCYIIIISIAPTKELTNFVRSALADRIERREWTQMQTKETE